MSRAVWVGLLAVAIPAAGWASKGSASNIELVFRRPQVLSVRFSPGTSPGGALLRENPRLPHAQPAAHPLQPAAAQSSTVHLADRREPPW